MKTPIVLVPGTCFTKEPLSQYFYGVERDLTNLGETVLSVKMPVFRTIEDRAAVLRREIRRHFGSQPVQLIAHSTGGLDCRFYISLLGGASQVTSLTTIGTPHRGSYLIRFWQEFLPHRAIQLLRKYCEKDGGTFDTYLQLGPDHLENLFNPAVADAPQVIYRSIVGELSGKSLFQGFPVFWLTSRILAQKDVGNDGFVSTGSATWGNVLAKINADHYQLVGHPFGWTRGFSHLNLYRELTAQKAS